MLDTNYKEAKKSWFHRYDNVSDYYRDANGPSSMHQSARSSRNTHGSWNGSDSFAETQERFIKGYPHGTAEAKKLLLQVTPYLRTVKGTSKGWRPQRYAGGNFILDNYVRGIPDVSNCMVPVISKKFASIIVNGTVSSSIGVEVMQRRGLVAVALTQVLESHGYRVSIKLANSTSGDNGAKLYCVVDLKPFNQTIELDRLAFFLADASAFRRLHFSWEETLPEDVRQIMNIPGGYGRPCELPDSEIGKDDIYLGCAHARAEHWYSLEGAIGYLKELLKRYGIES